MLELDQYSKVGMVKSFLLLMAWAHPPVCGRSSLGSGPLPIGHWTRMVRGEARSMPVTLLLGGKLGANLRASGASFFVSVTR